MGESKVSAEKNFFWHGILTLNDNGSHAFFHVEVKKNVPDAPNKVGIFTNDVPPLPMGDGDVMHVSFLLENNVGLNTIRYRVAESEFSGSLLKAALEQNPGVSSIPVQTETGEWVFQAQDRTWILRSIMLYVPMPQLRKFVKDP